MNIVKLKYSTACDICSNRGFCKLVKAREQYRLTKNLLIVNHETFFHDLWTRDERLDNGQLPILPDYCAVIFDEGNKVLLPASMQVGQQINREEIDTMIYAIEELQGARESLFSTAKKRSSIKLLYDGELILKEVFLHKSSYNHWSRYQRKYTYTNDILWKDIGVLNKISQC